MPASFVADATALLEEFRQLMQPAVPDSVPPAEVIAQAMRSITQVFRRLDGIYMLWFETRPEMQEVWTGDTTAGVRRTSHGVNLGLNPAA